MVDVLVLDAAPLYLATFFSFENLTIAKISSIPHK